MKRVFWMLLGLLLGAGLMLGLMAWRAPKTTINQADRERRFESSMRGVTLVGYSTRVNGGKTLSGEERYAIESVTKIAGSTWLFKARMKLDNSEWPMPIPVNIEWAGDTPVLTMTDASVPGFGSFTVRIVFYGDQYAGTWMGSGKNHGGQMFGQIVRERTPGRE